MGRAFLIVLDSVGAGGAPDADRFFNGTVPDSGANTLGHIAAECAAGRAEEGRTGPLHMPNLGRLGLGAAVRLASGAAMEGFPATGEGLWGAATEVSPGKDTPSGHWELAGVPVPWQWTFFPDTRPAFPPELTAEVCRLAGTGGILGNEHASGTEIIDRLGAEHMRTGWPICYTSADSVFQIAAHEETFGLERLIALCEALAPRLHAMRVGRCIARPFVGSPTEGFTRTPHRRDFAIAPPAPTLCDWAAEAGRRVYGIGKVGDIFSGRGFHEVRKGRDLDLFEHLVDLSGAAEDGSLTFANFVEFDTNFGHRRDVAGYARQLEWFDAGLPRVFERLGPGDLMIFTADHGNDPTWAGSDHTRERVPVVAWGARGAVGHVAFADVGASIAHHLGLSRRGAGRSFL
jgi:phosphopentomutase